MVTGPKEGRKQIVIVGGGVSGIITAQGLVGKGHNVIIVSAQSYFEWPIAGSYSLARPETFTKAVSAGDQHWPKGFSLESIKKVKESNGDFVVISKAVGINGDALQLEDGNELRFDVLIVAVGYNGGPTKPLVGQTLDERTKQINAIGAAVKSGKKLLIGGGGPVAFELAGDFREVNKDAEIIVVCRADRGLSYLSEKYQAKLQKQLEKQNIKLLVNASVVDEPTYWAGTKEFSLSTGTKIVADLYVPAFTTGFNGGFTGLANEQGQIPVNEFLQSAKAANIFAVGCNDKEFSAIGKIKDQSASVVNNVLAHLDGKPMKPHKDSMPLATHPINQKIGHHTYAWLEYEILPPGSCLKYCCGFPCGCCCCWPLALCGCTPCHPCACGYCCSDPEGSGTMSALRFLLHNSSGIGIKGLGTPKQQTMTE